MQKKIVYAGYFIIVTVFFLYYLFPGDAVTSYLNYKINSMSSDISMSIKKLKPDFPPGIKLSATNLLYRNQPIAGADFLKIKPSYLSLFSSNKTFFVNGDMYSGKLDSVIRLADFRSSPDFEAEASFANIQLSQIPIIEQFQSYRVAGIAGGELAFDNKEVKPGKGNAEIIVTDITVDFTPALFGLERVSFNSINADVDINGQRMELKRLNIDSRDVSGTATGSVVLRTPLNKSTINIRGELKPHPAFIKQMGSIFPVEMLSRKQSKTGGIPFRITGSLEQPNFALR
jgi:type II secretion system protein N